MVYKKYIKRGKKKFGPYYYESYRVGDKIKTRYIKKENKTDKNKKGKNLLRLIFFLGMVSFFIVLLSPQNSTITITLTSGNITDDGDIFYDIPNYIKQNTSTTASISADNRPYFEFNTASIPDTATIDSVVLNLTIDTALTTDTCSIYEMLAQPSTSSNQTIWDEAGNGTVYVSASTTCQSTEWQSWDLGSNAISILQNQLSDDWFAVGFTSSGTDIGAFNTSESNTAPQLIVSYRDIPPEITKNYPADENSTVNLDSDIIFNCSATDNSGLSNITLYTDLNETWEAFQTIDVTGTSDSATFIVNYDNFTNYSIVDNNFKWECLAYDDESYESNLTSNFTFSGWDLGTHSNTTYNTSIKAVTLIGNSSGDYPNTTGTYLSNIKNAGFVADWQNLSWGKEPYGRQLPDYQYDEIAAGISNGVNMSGNVMLFHFNNDSSVGENSTFVYDFSGLGNNGTAEGAIWTSSGKIKGAFDFDGVDDWINISFSPSLNISEDVTIEAWINSTSFSDTAINKTIVTLGDDSDDIDYSGARLYHDGPTLTFDIIINQTQYAVSSTVTPQANAWIHVVGVRSDSTIKIYVDGIETSSSAVAGILRSSLAPSPSNIGTLRPYTSTYFNGTIDEVAIYNRGLSAQEIYDHYYAGVKRLNLSLRSCDDIACSGESGEEWQLTCTNATYCDLSGLTDNRYIQYEALFETDDNTQTPELHNVTINFNPGITPPTLGGRGGAGETFITPTPICTDDCSTLGYECGTQSICSSLVNCGSCTGGKTCIAGKCVFCNENWSCSEWGNCIEGKETRICTDLNNCKTEISKPETTRTCCNENWKCDWDECIIEGEKYYTSPENCIDLNECGSERNKPGKIECKYKEKTKKLVPVVYKEGEEAEEVCLPEWLCEEWSECSAQYTLTDLLEGKEKFEGEQERVCKDKNKCSNTVIEKRDCDLVIPIKAKKVIWCNEEHVEIYEKDTGKLVSRIKKTKIAEKKPEIAMAELHTVEIEIETERIDIDFILTDFILTNFTGYCDYCFDNVKNYDETKIDCGGICPKCVEFKERALLSRTIAHVSKLV